MIFVLVRKWLHDLLTQVRARLPTLCSLHACDADRFSPLFWVECYQILDVFRFMTILGVTHISVVNGLPSRKCIYIDMENSIMYRSLVYQLNWGYIQTHSSSVPKGSHSATRVLVTWADSQQSHKELDDGWPESVEEQSLLLLVWRHYITTQYIISRREE